MHAQRVTLGVSRSAGILLFRRAARILEVFLVHPGGPFWAKKDAGAWSIPKGEYSDGEDPLSAGCREFEEETGFPVSGDFLPLGEIKQPSGKRVIAWAVEGDLDASAIRSNTFQLEWPPRSGKIRDFREVDAGVWFTVEEARVKLLAGQLDFLTRLIQWIDT